MLGALVQKAASCATSASGYGKLWYKLRPAVSTCSEIYNTGNVQTFRHVPLPGHIPSFKPKREYFQKNVTFQIWSRPFSLHSEPGDRVEVDEPIQTDKFVAEEEDIMELSAIRYVPGHINHKSHGQVVYAPRAPRPFGSSDQIIFVDMTNLIKLRPDYKIPSAKNNGVRFGLMSLLVKAAISASQKHPVVNAVLDDADHTIYRDHVNIRIAYPTREGGVAVPVMRNCENMSFDEIETEINRLARKPSDGTISIGGGTFTISYGGCYLKFLGTAIIEPPEKMIKLKSAILGMRTLNDRHQYDRGGDKAVRRTMALTLTIPHNLMGKREAKDFLTRIKDVMEQDTPTLFA